MLGSALEPKSREGSLIGSELHNDGSAIGRNDQLVYEKSGISFTFQGDRLVWPSNNSSEQIQNSPAFIALMTRNDCPAE